MAITRFEPFSLIQQFQNEMNKLFQNPLSEGLRDGSNVATSQWLPLVDIKEEADKFVVIADIPGVKIEDVEVSMERNILTLKGSRNFETKEETGTFVRIERNSGTFYRQFTLPDTADTNSISAKYTDGVLMVEIKKCEGNKSRKIEIKKTSH